MVEFSRGKEMLLITIFHFSKMDLVASYGDCKQFLFSAEKSQLFSKSGSPTCIIFSPNHWLGTG